MCGRNDNEGYIIQNWFYQNLFSSVTNETEMERIEIQTQIICTYCLKSPTYGNKFTR